MRLPLAALFLVLAPALPAQCHTEFEGTLYNPQVLMAGPGLLTAIRSVPNATLVARRLEIWTGKLAGQCALALWSHDAQNDRPKAQLGTVSFAQSATIGWQGADLANPVALAALSAFWLVIAPPAGSQASVEASGATLPGRQPYRESTNGGTSWGVIAQGHQWKLRVYCRNQIGEAFAFGQPCVGSTRFPPLAATVGVPTVHETCAFVVYGAPPATPVACNFGVSDTKWGALNLPIDLGLIQAPGCFVWCSGEISLTLFTDMTGTSFSPLSVPNLAALVGAVFFNQWAVVDPGANRLGLTTTHGLRCKVGGV